MSFSKNSQIKTVDWAYFLVLQVAYDKTYNFVQLEKWGRDEEQKIAEIQGTFSHQEKPWFFLLSDT